MDGGVIGYHYCITSQSGCAPAGPDIRPTPLALSRMHTILHIHPFSTQPTIAITNYTHAPTVTNSSAFHVLLYRFYDHPQASVVPQQQQQQIINSQTRPYVVITHKTHVKNILLHVLIYTRTKHEVADVQNAPNFVQNSKNPCWFEWNGRKDSLKCVPYFYLAGVPNAATNDLFTRLAHHPSVMGGGILNHNWWDRRRYGASKQLKYTKETKRTDGIIL